VSSVRVISRSEGRLRRAFPEARFEKRAADALDSTATRAALEGCDAVFDCIGLPMETIEQHPATARVIARAAQDTGARIVHVSSYWAYLPVQRLPLDETHPRSDGPRPVRMRREAEDILQQAGAAVVHLPDFFGPEVHTSTLQNALVEAAAGKTVHWIGPTSVEREYAYVPDAMAAVAELARREAAYGERWIVPGAGPASFDALLAIVAKHLGRAPKAQAASPWLLRLLGMVSRELRGFLPLVPHYVRPIRYDGAKLAALIGDVRRTPYERSLPATLSWLQHRDSGR
ncbi:MAG TPA: NAD(P)H-binding protein, partial [Pelomicrobium sp.]|nr:NAD(P)H-binding protein [Pelomicrobium sp.]